MTGSNPFENGGNTICFVALAVFLQNSCMESLRKPETESQESGKQSVTHLCCRNLKQLLVSFVITYIGELDMHSLDNLICIFFNTTEARFSILSHYCISTVTRKD